jgi:hypothetical protein
LQPLFNTENEFSKSFTRNTIPQITRDLYRIFYYFPSAVYLVNRGSLHGGDGGSPEHMFVDATEANLTYADYCTGAELHWTPETFLHSVAFIYTNNHTLLHRGRMRGTVQSTRSNIATFRVGKNEYINKVVLYKGHRIIDNTWKPEGKTELIVGIQFGTTKGNISPLYGTNESSVPILESPPQHYLAHAEGYTVGYVDRLAFIWYKKCSKKQTINECDGF